MSLQIVQHVRAKYPTPLGVKHGTFLLEVAAALGKGLVRKSWGTFVSLPDGTGVSQDCVMDPNGIHYDILGDGENQAIPSWQLVEDEGVTNADGSHPPLILPFERYYAVSALPPDVPPPQPPASNDLEERVDKLEESIAMLARSIATVNEMALGAQETADEALRLARAAADAASKAAKKGGPVSVTGSVSIRDVATSAKVTWTGRIL